MEFQYESERRKFAQDLINFDKLYAALLSAKPQTEENQGGVTSEVFSQYVIIMAQFYCH
jgi:phenol 2-monooxygenase